MDSVLRLPIEEKRHTSSAMDYALTVVETMGEQGLTTVPIKPTTAMLKADIDSGSTGDKVAHYDPGLSQLGTDDEAGQVWRGEEALKGTRTGRSRPAA